MEKLLWRFKILFFTIKFLIQNAAAAANPVLLGNGNGKSKPNNKVKQEAIAARVAQHSTIKVSTNKEM